MNPTIISIVETQINRTNLLGDKNYLITLSNYHKVIKSGIRLYIMYGAPNGIELENFEINSLIGVEYISSVE